MSGFLFRFVMWEDVLYVYHIEICLKTSRCWCRRSGLMFGHKIRKRWIQ